MSFVEAVYIIIIHNLLYFMLKMVALCFKILLSISFLLVDKITKMAAERCCAILMSILSDTSHFNDSPTCLHIPSYLYTKHSYNVSSVFLKNVKRKGTFL